MTFVKKFLPIICILGCMAMVLTFCFNLDNKLLIANEVNGIKFYSFDLNTYLQNINATWDSKALDFKTILPPRSYDTGIYNGQDVVKWIKTFINNTALTWDWLYFPINFVLYILRWVGYIMQLLISLLGWPMDKTGNIIDGHIQDTPEYSSTLATILVWIKQNLMIPYL